MRLRFRRRRLQRRQFQEHFHSDGRRHLQSRALDVFACHTRRALLSHLPPSSLLWRVGGWVLLPPPQTNHDKADPRGSGQSNQVASHVVRVVCVGPRKARFCLRDMTIDASHGEHDVAAHRRPPSSTAAARLLTWWRMSLSPRQWLTHHWPGGPPPVRGARPKPTHDNPGSR